MKNLYVKNLCEKIGEEIELQGFVDTIRDKKWVQFVIIRDNTGKVQITIEKSAPENQKMVELISSLPLESTVKIKGKVVANEAVKLNGLEIIPSSIIVTSERIGLELPFNFNDLSNVNLDTRLDNRFIDLRNEKNMKIFQIQSTLVRFMREFLYNNEFTEIHTPKFIGAASESGSEVFEVKYFDGKAYLAQSPQFYKQMAMSSGFNRVFEVAPCFRAENSNTSRHATEFTSFDVEMSYINSYEDVMDFEAEMLTYALTKTKEIHGEEIKELFGIEVEIPTLPFPKMTLKEIYKELKERYGYEIPESEQIDLTTEAEKLVYKLSRDKFNHEFMFVVDFPADKRAFYHMRDDNGKLLGYDLIWRGVEITTGAQREHRYENLCKVANEKGLGDDVKFYLDFFKYGCPPHGGFAIGVDRLTMLLLGVSNVKESMFLFRGPTRLNP